MANGSEGTLRLVGGPSVPHRHIPTPNVFANDLTHSTEQTCLIQVVEKRKYDGDVSSPTLLPERFGLSLDDTSGQATENTKSEEVGSERAHKPGFTHVWGPHDIHCEAAHQGQTATCN